MIHIKELFRLQDIQHLRLIAGRDGLERTVTAAVLFEYDPSRVQLPDFYRGDLVVTTLAYARGDAQLVAHSLQALMNQGIASLMVKTAYFSELPQSVIALANRLGTPVFLFDDTYIEEVILQVTDLIRGKRSTEKRIKESFTVPTLNAAAGDLSLVLPKRILDVIIEMIYALDKVAPGTANDGLYIIGDGSGITHSLSHASASGVHVARQISKQ